MMVATGFKKGIGRAKADGGCQTEFLVNMSASADVLAMAKVEVDLAAIPEGKNVRSFLSWALRGKGRS